MKKDKQPKGGAKPQAKKQPNAKAASNLNVLLVLLGVLITFGVYRGVYQPMNSQYEAAKTELATLQAELANLEALAANKSQYEVLSASMEEEMESLLEPFSAGFLPEDEIKFAYMSDVAGRNPAIHISSINFALPSLIYSNMVDAAATSGTTSTGDAGLAGDEEAIGALSQTDSVPTSLGDAAAATASSIISGGTADTESAATATVTDSSGVVTQSAEGEYYFYGISIGLGVETDYAGMKEMIDNVLASENRRTIETISMSFNEGDDELVLTLNTVDYYLLGTSKTYTAPELYKVPLGKENMFGQAAVLGEGDAAAQTATEEPAAE